MLPLIIGAGIAALGSVVGAIINKNSQEKSNKRMAQLQADLQRQQFDYEANYSTPEAQVQRLRDAGLNPNLMYGSSANTGNVHMGSVGAQKGASLDLDLNSIIGYSLEAMKLQKELKLADQQIENMKQTNEGISLDNQLKSGTLSFNIAKSEHDADIAFTTFQRMQEEVQALARENNFAEIDYARRTLESNVYQALLNDGSFIAMLRQQYKTPELQNKKLRADINLVNRTIANMQYEGDILSYKASLAKAGINPDEPYYGRILGMFAQGIAQGFGFSNINDAARALGNTLTQKPDWILNGMSVGTPIIGIGRAIKWAGDKHLNWFGNTFGKYLNKR